MLGRPLSCEGHLRAVDMVTGCAASREHARPAPSLAGEGKKAAKEGEAKKAAPVPKKRKNYDFTDETLVFETRAWRGRGSVGDGRAVLQAEAALPKCTTKRGWPAAHLPGRRRLCCRRVLLFAAPGPRPCSRRRCPPLLRPPPAAPHRGDLAVNVALGITLLWLPLSIAGERQPGCPRVHSALPVGLPPGSAAPPVPWPLPLG